MLLTDKYADKINGIITCNDRMIIQGYIPGWSYAEGMTRYLKANNIRIFDFADFSQPLTEQVRANAQIRFVRLILLQQFLKLMTLGVNSNCYLPFQAVNATKYLQAKIRSV